MSLLRNRGIRKVLRVSDEFAGTRLDRFLETHLDLSRSRIKKLLDEGHILLNGGIPRKAGVKVFAGAEVEVFIPEPEPLELVPWDLDIKVYFEDEHLAVIEKPAGIPVHPAAGHAQDTLANVLISRFPVLSPLGGRERPGIVHRLDKDTSGLMVVAKTEEAHMIMSRMFQDKKVKKIYVTVCWRKPPFLSGTVDAPIGRHPVDRKKMAVVEGGREAITKYVVFDSSDRFSVLLVRIYTGRTHQIRVHMHHLGCPVLGDAIYGRKGLDLIHRQALHAAYLDFDHPVRSERISVFSPLPEDVRQCIEKLGLKLPERQDLEKLL